MGVAWGGKDRGRRRRRKGGLLSSGFWYSLLVLSIERCVYVLGVLGTRIDIGVLGKLKYQWYNPSILTV